MEKEGYSRRWEGIIRIDKRKDRRLVWKTKYYNETLSKKGKPGMANEESQGPLGEKEGSESFIKTGAESQDRGQKKGSLT